jgi:hypothetical protein
VARQDDSLGAKVTAVVDVSKAYARQEVTGPLKSLGRFIGAGLAGAVLLGIGVVCLALALLRGIQTTEWRWLSGTWSFVPYLIVIAVLIVVAALAGLRIKKVSQHL